jgi:SAM-dependent methyltransferase
MAAALAYPSKLAQPDLRLESIRSCAHCGFGEAEPRPTQEQLDDFYRSGKYWHSGGTDPYQLAHENQQSRLRVERILPWLARRQGLRVADIGAGHGCIARWLSKTSGINVSAYDFIEPDDNNARAIEAADIPFQVSRKSGAAALPEGSYDVVFMNHVLEHVADPVLFTTQIFGALRAGGIAYVETPHLDYRFKEDVFPHTLFFTRDAFAALGSRTGVIQLECDQFGAWPGRAAGISTPAYKALARLFRLSVKLGWGAMQQTLDNAIWRYGNNDDGIWLRWIVRRAPAGAA